MTLESGKTRKIFDGRYEIVSIVGRGAASVVYHARRATAPFADVAIKVLTDKAEGFPSKERLRKEALAMLYAKHRYVIHLDDFRTVGDLCYLSMEYAPLSDLRKYAHDRGEQFTYSQRERFLLQMAEALGYLHRANVIHRDIKPENILVMSETECRLGDFGVAVLRGEETEIKDLQRGVGTMDYLAPEVLAGKACDQRSDVYSLALSFYEIFAGKHPFADIPLMQQVEARRDGSFPSLGEVNPQVADFVSNAIMRALSFDPAARYETGQQFFDALLLGRDKSKKQGPAFKTRKNDANRVEMLKPKILPPAEPVGQSTVRIAERDTTRETVVISRDDVAALREAHEAPSSSPTGPGGTQTLSPNERTETSTNLERHSPEMLGDASNSNADPLGAGNENIFRPITPRSLGTAEQSESIGSRMAEISSALSALWQAAPSQVRYGILGAAGALMVIVMLLARSSSPGSESDTDTGTANNNAHQSRTIPSIALDQLEFPNLPSGLYTGNIEGLIPGTRAAMSFYVPPKRSGVIVFIGMSGWTPRLNPFPKSDSANQYLRISSNGIILHMTGKVEDGQIVGFFTDKINGVQGRWEVTPVGGK